MDRLGSELEAQKGRTAGSVPNATGHMIGQPPVWTGEMMRLTGQLLFTIDEATRYKGTMQQHTEVGWFLLVCNPHASSNLCTHARCAFAEDASCVCVVQPPALRLLRQPVSSTVMVATGKA